MMDRYSFALTTLLSLVLFVGFGPGALAQTGSIEGTVIDGSTGEALPGANIAVEGQNVGASSDQDGRYSISDIDPGVYTVQASFVGYEEGIEENVEVVAGETTVVDFELVSTEQALEEVVVVGYGEQRQEQVTGSVSQVGVSDVEDIGAPSASEALQGQASGLMVHRTGVPGQSPEVRIRGLNTLNSNDPLFIVDGVERDNLLGINTSDIESIEVLKDASAASIYGSRASGGVVLISTKSGQAGEIQVDVNSSVGLRNPHQRLDLLSTEQYVELNTELRQNAGSPPPARFDEEGFPGSFPETDWQDAYFENSLYSNNNIAISGGTEDARARVSFGYLTEEGTIPETGYERYSLSVNSDFEVGWFQFSENLSISHGTDDLRRGDGMEGLIQIVQ